MKCLNKQNEMLLCLVTNGNSKLLFFYMGVNSLRADNLSPRVPRILNKKEANIFGQFLCVCSSSLIFFNLWVFYDIHFSPRSFLKVKKNETVQMFFEDCMAPS